MPSENTLALGERDQMATRSTADVERRPDGFVEHRVARRRRRPRTTDGREGRARDPPQCTTVPPWCRRSCRRSCDDLVERCDLGDFACESTARHELGDCTSIGERVDVTESRAAHATRRPRVSSRVVLIVGRGRRSTSVTPSNMPRPSPAEADRPVPAVVGATEDRVDTNVFETAARMLEQRRGELGGVHSDDQDGTGDRVVAAARRAPRSPATCGTTRNPAGSHGPG